MNKVDILEAEAAYQDLKVENSKIRSKTKGFYNDSSSIFLNEFRNKLIGDVSGKKSLDYGCGKGEFSLNLLRGGSRNSN